MASKTDLIQMWNNTRNTISSLDAILVTLLTQGNTFVIGILSVPNLNPHMDPRFRAAFAAMGTCVSLSLFAATWLYRNLLKTAVAHAEDLESDAAFPLDARQALTHQLDKVMLSGGHFSSNILYVFLPGVVTIASVLNLAHHTL